MKYRYLLFSFMLITASMAIPPFAACNEAAVPTTKTSEVSDSIPDIQDRLDFAAGLYARDMYDMAAQEYQTLIETHKDHPEIALAYLGLAETSFFAQDYEKSMFLFRTFFDRFPNHSKIEMAKQRISECLYKLGHFKDATEAFGALKNSPDLTAKTIALYYSGKLAMKSNDLQRAETNFKQVPKKSQDNSYWEYANEQLGEIALKQNDGAKAITFFNQIKESNDSEVKQLALFGLGRAYFMQKDYEKSEENFLNAYRLPMATIAKDEALLAALKAMYNSEKYGMLVDLYETEKKSLTDPEKINNARFLVASSLALEDQHDASGEMFDLIVNDQMASARQREDALLGKVEIFLRLGKGRRL